MILRNKATSPITRPQPEPPSRFGPVVTKKTLINTAPFKKIAEDANFADIVNENISVIQTSNILLEKISLHFSHTYPHFSVLSYLNNLG